METIENKSSGIATMINSMRDLKLEPPVFEDKRENFTVTFKNHNLMTKEDREWLQALQVSLTEDEAYALVFLRNNQRLTNGDYQKINNVNRDRALSDIRELISKGVIKAQGFGSGTYYILKDSDQDNKQLSIEDISKEGFNESGDKVIGSGDKVAISNDKMMISGDKFNENEKKIINYLNGKQHINNLEARSILGLSPSGARKVLKEMADKKIVEPEGTNKNRIYKLNKQSN